MPRGIWPHGISCRVGSDTSPLKRQRRLEARRHRSRRTARNSRCCAMSRSRSARSAGPLPKSRGCGAWPYGCRAARAPLRAAAGCRPPAAFRRMCHDGSWRRFVRTARGWWAFTPLRRRGPGRGAEQARAVVHPHSVGSRPITPISSCAQSGAAVHQVTPMCSRCAFTLQQLAPRKSSPVVCVACRSLHRAHSVVLRAGRGSPVESILKGPEGRRSLAKRSVQRLQVAKYDYSIIV